MKRLQWLWITGTGVLCVAVLVLALSRTTLFADAPSQQSVRPTVVVDAGHGGVDGGAVAPDGTGEKGINLAVAKPLRSLLTLLGFDVTMTREDDAGLYDDTDASVREKKVSDMKRRLEMFEQADLNISVHQNMFAATGCHGTQVFYSENHPFSKKLAACVQEALVTQLQPDNTRELKTGNRDIYLLYKTTKPSVLVECGFLSNAEELAKLKDEVYQRQLAFAIACGTVRYAAEVL